MNGSLQSLMPNLIVAPIPARSSVVSGAQARTSARVKHIRPQPGRDRGTGDGGRGQGMGGPQGQPQRPAQSRNNPLNQPDSVPVVRADFERRELRLLGRGDAAGVFTEHEIGDPGHVGDLVDQGRAGHGAPLR